MLKRLQEDIEENERAFFATLCATSVLLIELFYLSFYDVSPSPIVLLFPLLFWIVYHGNRHEPATSEGYWVWVILLIIITILVIIFPLF